MESVCWLKCAATLASTPKTLGRGAAYPKPGTVTRSIDKKMPTAGSWWLSPTFLRPRRMVRLSPRLCPKPMTAWKRLSRAASSGRKTFWRLRQPRVVPWRFLVRSWSRRPLYEALRQEGLSKSALARVIGIQESEVRRMLNPKHPAKIGRLEKALSRVGKRLVVAVEQAP